MKTRFIGLVPSVGGSQPANFIIVYAEQVSKTDPAVGRGGSAQFSTTES
jgi:hypothetical protein